MLDIVATHCPDDEKRDGSRILGLLAVRLPEASASTSKLYPISNRIQIQQVISSFLCN